MLDLKVMNNKNGMVWGEEKLVAMENFLIMPSTCVSLLLQTSIFNPACNDCISLRMHILTSAWLVPHVPSIRNTKQTSPPAITTPTHLQDKPKLSVHWKVDCLPDDTEILNRGNSALHSQNIKIRR